MKTWTRNEHVYDARSACERDVPGAIRSGEATEYEWEGWRDTWRKTRKNGSSSRSSNWTAITLTVATKRADREQM